MYQREILEWEKKAGVHRIFLTMAAQNSEMLYQKYQWQNELVWNQLRLISGKIIVIWLPGEEIGRYVKWKV